jgi:acyl carrier protein
MLDRIIEILTEYTDIDPADITENSEIIKDLAINSLDIMEAVTAMEDTFDIEIPDRDISKFGTVGDIVEYLNGKKNHKRM